MTAGRSNFLTFIQHELNGCAHVRRLGVSQRGRRRSDAG